MLFSKQNGGNKQLHHSAFATLQGGHKTALEISRNNRSEAKTLF